MPDLNLLIIGAKLGSQIYSSEFLVGIVQEFVGAIGYDLGKSGLRPLGDRIASIWREGGEFKNHDLLRALRYAECQAVVAVCSTCLLEDYKTYPTLARAFVEGPMPYLANPEVRQIARIRREYHRLSRKVLGMSQAEIESQMAAQLSDVGRLVSSAREICNVQTADELRERTTRIVREAVVASAEPDLLTRAQKKIGNLFKRGNGGDTEGVIPPKLLERIERHWFDMFRLSFREVLKDDKFAKARRAFEMDVLSQLSDSSLHNLGAIEAKLDERDKKLDYAVSILKQIEGTFGKGHRAKGKNLNALFARQQQEFGRALAEYQQEVIARLERIAESQGRIEKKQDVVVEHVSASGQRVIRLLRVVFIASVLAAGILIYNLMIPPTPVGSGVSGSLTNTKGDETVEPTATYLRLLVKDRQGNVVSGAAVEVDALPGQVFTTASDGGLSIEEIPRKIGDQVRIKVAKGNRFVDEYVVLPGPKTVSLN